VLRDRVSGRLDVLVFMLCDRCFPVRPFSSVLSKRSFFEDLCKVAFEEGRKETKLTSSTGFDTLRKFAQTSRAATAASDGDHEMLSSG